MLPLSPYLPDEKFSLLLVQSLHCHLVFPKSQLFCSQDFHRASVQCSVNSKPFIQTLEKCNIFNHPDRYLQESHKIWILHCFSAISLNHPSSSQLWLFSSAHCSIIEPYIILTAGSSARKTKYILLKFLKICVMKKYIVLSIIF